MVLSEQLQGLTVKVKKLEQTDGVSLFVVIVEDPGEPEECLRLVERPGAEQTKCRYLLIPDRAGHLLLPWSDIRWVEAGGSYCRLHLAKRKDCTLSFPLSCIERALPERCFVRIQRSYVVNLDYVDRIWGNSFVLGDEVLKIGREYRKRVMEYFCVPSRGKSRKKGRKTGRKKDDKGRKEPTDDEEGRS